MTRLQNRNTSCGCGKTAREKESFVVTTKFYETRSSGRLLNGANFIRRRKTSDRINMGKNLYLRKMNNSLIKIGGKDKCSMNANSKLKTRKPSKTRAATPNGTARSLIGNAIDDLLSRKLGMDIIESNCIRSKDKLEEFPVSSELVPNGMVSNIDSEHASKLRKSFQNGGFDSMDCNAKTSFDSKNNVLVKEELVQENFVEESEDNKKNSVESISQLAREEIVGLVDKKKDCKYEVILTEKPLLKIRKRKKKTDFQKFIEASTELNVCPLSEKRFRKRPESFSQVLKRTIKCENLAPKKSNLTLSGRLKKKCGRKPKPKGPISHYLDVYVQNKEKVQIIPAAGCSIDEVVSENHNTAADSVENECIHKESSEKLSPLISSGDDFFPSTLLDTVCEPRKVKKKITKKKAKKTPHKTKNMQKEFDQNIQSVLGYRSSHNVSEFLVLFENGTSNWVSEETSDPSLFKNLQTFFNHTDQDQVVMHRFGFAVTQNVKQNDLHLISSESVSTITDSAADDDDNDDEDSNVFFNKIARVETMCDIEIPNSRKGDIVHAQLSPPIQASDRDSCPTNINRSSDHHGVRPASDLNKLCHCVMSSKHVKLYPYETTKDIVCRKEGGFVHVYLKGLNKKVCDRKKIDEYFNTETCEKLITILEDCAVHDGCDVVVIGGLEDFFASSYMFDKLLKKSSLAEGKKYEQEVSLLRYLVQTIRNFNKPIVAVIKKAAVGLPASMLSLFDMVFHEGNTEGGTSIRNKKKKKNKMRNEVRVLEMSGTDDITTDDQSISSEDLQNFVFPRLLGLTESNEARIMGEHYKPASGVIDQVFVNTTYSNRVLSQQLRNSVRHMKNNSKIQMKHKGRSQSINSEDELNNCDIQNATTRMEGASNVTTSELEIVRKKVELEKKLTREYMTEFVSYVRSLESNDVI